MKRKSIIPLFLLLLLLFGCLKKENREDLYAINNFNGTRLLTPRNWSYYLEEGTHRFSDNKNYYLSVRFYPIEENQTIDAIKSKMDSIVKFYQETTYITDEENTMKKIDIKSKELEDQIYVRFHGKHTKSNGFFDFMVVCDYKQFIVLHLQSIDTSERDLLKHSNYIFNSLRLNNQKYEDDFIQ